jgi:hypothetical protein
MGIKRRSATAQKWSQRLADLTMEDCDEQVLQKKMNK